MYWVREKWYAEVGMHLKNDVNGKKKYNIFIYKNIIYNIKIGMKQCI